MRLRFGISFFNAMIRRLHYISLSFLLAIVLGCGGVQECAKTLWGSSTRALEAARADGIRRYARCSYRECFQSVQSFIAREAKTPSQPEGLVMFAESQARRYIVVMGIPGSIDTTEVGIFFEPVDEDWTIIDISSLSSSAAAMLSEMLLPALEQDYTVTDTLPR